MEFYQLRYFCAVARTGSFTRAAEQEGVSQSSLSEAVQRLETHLEAPLLERLGRSVRLTPYGERLLPHAQEVLRRLVDARNDLASLRQRPAGPLAVGCVPTLLPYFLAPRLASFTTLHPDVDIQLIEDTTPRLAERLQAGELDLFLAGMPLRTAGLQWRELFREPLLLAVPQQHRLARESCIALSALAAERVLLLKKDHCLRDNALLACRRARVPLRASFEGDHLQGMLALVAAGFGVSFVPAMAASLHPHCRFVPFQPACERRVGYARLRGHAASPAQSVFVEWLRGLGKTADGPVVDEELLALSAASRGERG